MYLRDYLNARFAKGAQSTLLVKYSHVLYLAPPSFGYEFYGSTLCNESTTPKGWHDYRKKQRKKPTPRGWHDYRKKTEKKTNPKGVA